MTGGGSDNSVGGASTVGAVGDLLEKVNYCSKMEQ